MTPSPAAARPRARPEGKSEGKSEGRPEGRPEGKPEGRAAPLPPAERREAILAKVVPLLVARGAGATSRELAAAAGVAEGTIFKVFIDKDDLLTAALDRVIDPAPFERAITEIDPHQPFEARLVAATELIQRRMMEIWTLLGQLGPGARRPRASRIPDSDALTAIFAADAARLRLPATEAARRLRALVMSLSNPVLLEPLTPAEIVDQFLHGAEAHP